MEKWNIVLTLKDFKSELGQKSNTCWWTSISDTEPQSYSEEEEEHKSSVLWKSIYSQIWSALKFVFFNGLVCLNKGEVVWLLPKNSLTLEGCIRSSLLKQLGKIPSHSRLLSQPRFNDSTGIPHAMTGKGGFFFFVTVCPSGTCEQKDMKEGQKASLSPFIYFLLNWSASGNLAKLVVSFQFEIIRVKIKAWRDDFSWWSSFRLIRATELSRLHPNSSFQLLLKCSNIVVSFHAVKCYAE